MATFFHMDQATRLRHHCSRDATSLRDERAAGNRHLVHLARSFLLHTHIRDFPIQVYLNKTAEVRHSFTHMPWMELFFPSEPALPGDFPSRILQTIISGLSFLQSYPSHSFRVSPG